MPHALYALAHGITVSCTLDSALRTTKKPDGYADELTKEHSPSRGFSHHLIHTISTSFVFSIPLHSFLLLGHPLSVYILSSVVSSTRAATTTPARTDRSHTPSSWFTQTSTTKHLRQLAPTNQTPTAYPPFSYSPSSTMSSAASGSNRPSGSVQHSNTSTTSVSIPETAAAGGITVNQPPSTASASYYKIAKDEFITFGWNLTSL